MDDALIERAVEAAAKAAYVRVNPYLPWDSLWKETREEWCDRVREAVTAALAEVEADIRAGALRDAADGLDESNFELFCTADALEWLRYRAECIEKVGKA